MNSGSNLISPGDFVNNSGFAIGDGQNRMPFEMTATNMLNTGSRFMQSVDGNNLD
jgi:hypothetical protein